ncbi:MAG: hypothetical protein K0S44_23 [Bacteroidetes bacterium]|jgi:hypothetical protein|nr:hypothetical protein [Bacteroidota bacterium]
MTVRKQNSPANIVIIIIAVLLFCYTAFRAMILSITWDEAYTYIEFARNGKVLLESYDLMSANNHILNTWLMILFTKAFGVSEFVMRMPVLFTYILYLCFSAKLAGKINRKWFSVTAFIVLNVNPYMIDFFTVARGYGLSIGLMMSSLYFLYQFNSERKTRSAVISLIFAGIAVLASFVLLHYFLVLFGLIIILTFYYEQENSKERTGLIIKVLKKLIAPFLVAILLFLFVIPITLDLKAAGALFFGGERSFWSDTISTIVDRCFYEIGYNYWLQRITKAFIFLVLICSAIYFCLKFFKKQLNTNTLFLGSCLFLISFCCLSTVVQHHLMGTAYLLDRTALFLVILFSLIFVFFITELSAQSPLSVYLVHVSAAFMLIHFFLCCNLTYVLEWRFDANTKEMLSDLNEIKAVPKGKETVSVGIPLIFHPATNFYRELKDYSWLNTTWRKETNNMLHDYFCISKNDLKGFNMDSLQIIKTYPGTGNMLARPRYPVKEYHAQIEKIQTFPNENEGRFIVNENVEYAPGFSYIINDSITPDKKGIVAFYAEVKAPDKGNNNLIMVISFQDEKGSLYSWQKAYVKDLIKDEDNWFRANFTCIIPAEAKGGDELKLYIWNPDKHQLFIKEQEFKWLVPVLN